MTKMTKLQTEQNWKGYTLDELRYRRARKAAETQVSKILLSQRFEALRTGNPVTRSWDTMRDIFSAIGYVNSAVLAFQLFRRLRGLWRVVRH